MDIFAYMYPGNLMTYERPDIEISVLEMTGKPVTGVPSINEAKAPWLDTGCIAHLRMSDIVRHKKCKNLRLMP